MTKRCKSVLFVWVFYIKLFLDFDCLMKIFPCFYILQANGQFYKVKNVNHILILILIFSTLYREGTPGRHEPLLCRQSLPDSLGRPSLHYAVNEPPPYSTALINLGIYEWWKLLTIFLTSFTTDYNCSLIVIIRNIYGLLNWFKRFILKL